MSKKGESSTYKVHRYAETYSEGSCLQVLKKHYDPTTTKLSSVSCVPALYNFSIYYISAAISRL